MGGRGNAGNRNSSAEVEEKFTYERSPEIKEWSAAEEKRTNEVSKYVFEKVFRTGDYQEFYEENIVEEIARVEIPGDVIYKDDEISITKMNLIYAQNWDENDHRVKRGKPLTGSTYYTVQTEDGAIDENQFAYKTKADAEHAMRLYLDRERQWRAYKLRQRRDK